MRLAAALVSLAALHAFAQKPFDPNTVERGPETRWFNLDKTSTGYLAAGNLANTFWAFHVRGHDMKRLAVTTFSVDGAILQVRAIPRSIVKGGTGMNPLGAHKSYEQAHLAEEAKGSTFGDHNYCRDAKEPHQQWVSQSPGGISQAFVTFVVGDYVLMIASPYENAVRENAVARAIGDACATFRTEKNKG